MENRHVLRGGFLYSAMLILKKLLNPISVNEDDRRREFILNILLLGAITIFFIASCINAVAIIISPHLSADSSYLSLIPLVIVCALLVSLYLISRKGRFQIAAYVLVVVLFVFAGLMEYYYSVGVVAALLIHMLVIIMSGILISTRFAFTTTIITIIAITIITALHFHGVVIPDLSWRNAPWNPQDTAMACVIFVITASISWLSNREIEKSLARAKSSEKTLREERDMLEVVVEERTRELRESQLEKISQLYSFAEFGRLSSGLFHDLMNPLTAVSLNVQMAQIEGRLMGDLTKVENYLEQAFVAAKRMERFVGAIRKQIGNKRGELSTFSIIEETRYVMEILSFKAQHARVHIKMKPSKDITFYGDAVRFSQIMLNLITNAIDAYDEEKIHYSARDVIVSFSENVEGVVGTVVDHGAGITAENINAIFTPFFTTKRSQLTKGTGLGLSITRTIIEKDFNGTIVVASEKGKETRFTFTLPKQ